MKKKSYDLELSRKYNLPVSLIDYPYYFIKDKVSTSLEECLNKITYLDDLYLDVTNYQKVKGKAKTKEDKIKELVNLIPITFKNYLDSDLNYIEINIIEDTIKKVLVNPSDNLFTLGVMYIYIANNDIELIIPKELIDIYKNYKESNLGKKNDIKRTEPYLVSYLMSNCYIPIDLMNDLIINDYNCNITEKEIKELALNLGFHIYKNKYYSYFELNDSLFENLNKRKKEYSYLKYSDMEINEYFKLIEEFAGKLEEYIEPNLVNHILTCLFILHDQAIDMIKDITGEENQDKVLEIIDKYIDDLRLWSFNGRTNNDLIVNDFVLENTVEKIPKKLSYKTLIKESKDTKYKDLIQDGLADNLDSCIDIYIDTFKDIIEEYDYNSLSYLLDDNVYLQFTYDVPVLLFEYFYYYKTEDGIKVLIPDELKDALENYVITKTTENEDQDVLVTAYLQMNGVLEKKKLQELLSNYHNLKIPLNKLDKIAERGGNTILGKYYTYMPNIDMKLAKSIISVKNSINYYGKVNFTMIRKNLEYEDELNELVSKETKFDEEFLTLLAFMSYNGGINANTIKYLDVTEFKISRELEDKIIDLYDKYKDYIYRWEFNGFTESYYRDVILDLDKNKI